LLSLAENAIELAVVMGHEITHAIARHEAKRMAYQKLVQIGSMASSVALGDMDYQTRKAVMGALEVSAQ
jgi:metalloendopeptidase OMA1, mitochondrial